MTKSTYLLFITFLFSYLLTAQEVQKAITTLKNDSNAIITQNKGTGAAEFVRFPIGYAMSLKGATPRQKAFSFLQSHKDIYNIDDVSQNLVFEKEETDNYGLTSVVLKQQYKGVPIFDGQLRFHFNTNKELTSINGNFIAGISKLNQVPSLNSSKANAIALNAIIKQDLNGSGKPLFIHSTKLYVFAKGLIQGKVTSHHLVYEIEVRNELDVREFLYVDAHSGKIVEQFTGMAHALDRKIYEDNTSNLVWREGDALPGTLTKWQINEVEASGHTYYFFKHAFGRDSYNGAGTSMRTINNNPDISCPNASWNGATANFCDGTAADDIIAHEWGHAYTQFTSDLIYAYQSGAINEAYSDIWGETVDILNNYEDTGENLSIRTNNFCFSSRWKIGEDATAFRGAIRDMWNPSCNGDPGKVTDSQYRCDEADFGGVHSNSGIPNHAFALLVDGGSFNGQVIGGIGFTKAAHIFWRAQNVYLTRTSDFSSLADALESSANDLIGINLQGLSTTSIPSGPSGEIISPFDVQNVTNAILAVELRTNPDACNFQPILPVAPTICDASKSNPLFFENWESGIGAWTVSQFPSNPATWQSRDWAITSSLPDGREGSAMYGIDPVNGNCSTDFENGIIRLKSPVITIPNITDGTFDMAFNHYVATENLWDGGNIKYRLNGGEWLLLPSSAFLENPYNATLNTTDQGNDNPMQGEDAFTGTDGGSVSGSWGQSVVDLSALGVTANSTIQFQFEMGTDGCSGNDGWYVDEIVIYNCSATLSISDSKYLEDGIRIYPNPSNGIFTLRKIRAIELDKAKIFDINGRTIKSIDLSRMQDETAIDITDVASGIYFMSVTSKDAKSVIKLIKD